MYSAGMARSITSYGVYVPRHRLQMAELAAALGSGSPKGSRAVAAFDEDATTMGVEAARQALPAGQRPGSIFLATTTPPYQDKTNATAIHAALDLGHEGFAVDVAGAVRSGVGALRAAAASGGMAVLSDVRTGRPGSADERAGGDGAAAFVFGDGPALAEVVGEASRAAEFLDRWRAPGALAGDQWEERFGLEQYVPLALDAAQAALAAAGVEQADHVLVSSAHARAQATVAKKLGSAARRMPESAALDVAQPGETILLVVAADGADALVLRATEQLPQGRAGTPVAEQAAGGRDVGYTTYLSWRGFLQKETPRRPEPGRPAGPPSARSEAWKFAFVGTSCDACGQVHVPPRRVCVNCGATDQMSRAPLATKPGTVATYTVDRLAFSPSPPMIDAVVDFEGGGRYTLEVADAGPDEVEIGTPVELTFRRLYTTGGVHNYFWKARVTSPDVRACEDGRRNAV
jgi:hydroxymethylglutaryl-CoA synthase